MNKVVESLKDDEPLLDSVLIHMGACIQLWGSLRAPWLYIKEQLVFLKANTVSPILCKFVVICLCWCSIRI